MKHLTATICLTLAVLLGSAGMSESADFQKGAAAYQSGDYATTLREWKPLAEQGDADGQSNLGVMVKSFFRTALIPKRIEMFGSKPRLGDRYDDFSNT